MLNFAPPPQLFLPNYAFAPPPPPHEYKPGTSPLESSSVVCEKSNYITSPYRRVTATANVIFYEAVKVKRKERDIKKSVAKAKCLIVPQVLHSN
jgi:hypothetical protein